MLMQLKSSVQVRFPFSKQFSAKMLLIKLRTKVAICWQFTWANRRNIFWDFIWSAFESQPKKAKMEHLRNVSPWPQYDIKNWKASINQAIGLNFTPTEKNYINSKLRRIIKFPFFVHAKTSGLVAPCEWGVQCWVGLERCRCRMTLFLLPRSAGT